LRQKEQKAFFLTVPPPRRPVLKSRPVGIPIPSACPRAILLPPGHGVLHLMRRSIGRDQRRKVGRPGIPGVLVSSARVLTFLRPIDRYGLCEFAGRAGQPLQDARAGAGGPARANRRNLFRRYPLPRPGIAWKAMSLLFGILHR